MNGLHYVIFCLVAFGGFVALPWIVEQADKQREQHRLRAERARRAEHFRQTETFRADFHPVFGRWSQLGRDLDRV